MKERIFGVECKVAKRLRPEMINEGYSSKNSALNFITACGFVAAVRVVEKIGDKYKPRTKWIRPETDITKV